MTSSLTPRSHSRTSIYSATTYHSFQDIELYEPGTSSETSATTTSARGPRVAQLKETPVRRSRPFRSDDFDRHPSSFQMVRQDSGYESSTPHHHASKSSSKQHRSSSNRTSPSPPRADRPRQRPPLRRSGNGPISHIPARSSLTLNRPTSLSTQQQQNLNRKHSYFQFPSPDHLDGQDHQSSSSARPSVDLAPVILKVNTANANSSSDEDRTHAPRDSLQDAHRDYHHHPNSPVSPYHHHPAASPPPPQTTHYWTSDRTRRLEYAAIDAASRGVRGWVMRNVVPDCFVSRESRRLGFDDDGGSVRRYRLDLEIECPDDSVPPSPLVGVDEKKKKKPLRGFRARGRAGDRGWWARLRGCT